MSYHLSIALYVTVGEVCFAKLADRVQDRRTTYLLSRMSATDVSLFLFRQNNCKSGRQSYYWHEGHHTRGTKQTTAEAQSRTLFKL